MVIQKNENGESLTNLKITILTNYSHNYRLLFVIFLLSRNINFSSFKTDFKTAIFCEYWDK